MVGASGFERPPGPEPNSIICWDLEISVEPKCLLLYSFLLKFIEPKYARSHKIIYNRVVVLSASRSDAGFGTLITGAPVRRYFDGLDLENKQQIAANPAKRFPNFSWRLPRPKKPYESEPRSMLIFDAVAKGSFLLAKGWAKPRNRSRLPRTCGTAPRNL